MIDISSNDYKFAGFWWRLLAYLIDNIVTSLVFSVLILIKLICLYITINIFHMNSQSLIKSYVFSIIFMYSISIFMVWIYHTMMESSSWQATIGERICGLTVVDIDGNRISFGRANGRYFAGILSGLILCIGFFMIGWTEKKQGLHDMIAGTLVLRRKQ